MRFFLFYLYQYSMRSLIILIIFIENVFPYLKEPRPDEGAEFEDRNLKALEILRKYGYPAENHTVTTEDGYILTIHRIPYGRLCPKNETKGPILLQHGLFCSSMEFITPGTKRALAYVLADSCYDVWLPNHRGNTYSRAHTTLSVNSREYWNFSWHELGIYDLPASIDYILNYTNYKNLLFSGHSQGGTVYLVLTSVRPEYNEKIRAGFLLAPIGFMAHGKSEIMKYLLGLGNVLTWAWRTFQIMDFLSHTRLITEAGGIICRKSDSAIPDICEQIVFLLCGYDTEGFNNTIFPVLLGHTPAGAAMKQVLHYAQSRQKGTFAYFDYGVKKNIEIYGQREPPDYDLSKITAPTLIYQSHNDWLAPPKDIDMLYERLNCPKKKIMVPHKKFNHVDFLYSKDVLYLLYDSLVETLEKYILTK